MSREERDALSPADAQLLDDQVHDRAALGFQYRYEGIRIPDAGEAPDEALGRFAAFMASEVLLGFLGEVVGRDDIAFSEGQATAYGPGDFLTCHDDGVEGRHRLAAFVLGITPRWRPEWGGLLLFHADDDSAAIGHVPRWNTLDLFAVPQRHSVTYVNRSAPGRRLALTGWLRTPD
jgi:Rps23 Pro-64 3,4-dihydroxylase Tpa1-like proline 4-hydroxylase